MDFEAICERSVRQAERKQEHIFQITKEPRVLTTHYFLILLNEIVEQNLLSERLLDEFRAK